MTSAPGYRIGPFDVESVLVTHDQVVEAAVIGVPDQLRGEAIEAFVMLRDPSQDTAGELQQMVKDKFAAHAYPRRNPALPRRQARPLVRDPGGQKYLLVPAACACCCSLAGSREGRTWPVRPRDCGGWFTAGW